MHGALTYHAIKENTSTDWTHKIHITDQRIIRCGKPIFPSMRDVNDDDNDDDDDDDDDNNDDDDKYDDDGDDYVGTKLHKLG